MYFSKFNLELMNFGVQYTKKLEFLMLLQNYLLVMKFMLEVGLMLAPPRVLIRP